MATISELLFKLTATTGGFESGTKRAQKSLRSLGQEATALQKTLSTIGVGLSAAAVTQFLKSTVTEFAKAETAAMRLQHALRTMGRSTSVSSIQAFAEQMQASTVFDDDTIIAAAAAMAKFGNVSDRVFGKSLRAAADIAAQTGEALESVVETLGKSLNNPAQAGKLLRGFGITPAEMDNIKKGNTLLEQQLRLLDAINKRVGGAAQAQGATTAGRVQQLANAWGNLKEAIGENLANRGLGRDLETITRIVSGKVGGTLAGDLEQRLSGLGGPSTGREESLARLRELMKMGQEITARQAEIAKRHDELQLDVLGNLEDNAELDRLRRLGEAIQFRANVENAAIRNRAFRNSMFEDFRVGIGNLFGLDPTQAGKGLRGLAAGGQRLVGRGIAAIEPHVRAFANAHAAGLANQTFESLPVMLERLRKLAAGIGGVLQAAGGEVFESSMTPGMQMQREMAKLKLLRATGAIDDATFVRAAMQAQQGMRAASHTAGAPALFGSAEAAATMFRHRDPVAKAEMELAKQQLRELKEHTDVLERIERGVKTVFKVVHF
jgi:hypothetical protein